jgi:hypothetical protein
MLVHIAGAGSALRAAPDSLDQFWIIGLFSENPKLRRQEWQSMTKSAAFARRSRDPESPAATSFEHKKWGPPDDYTIQKPKFPHALGEPSAPLPLSVILSSSSSSIAFLSRKLPHAVACCFRLALRDTMNAPAQARTDLK